ncbi:MAG TPA: potassium channel family protein [Candidatus Sulfotelmatobacter sp.]|nr:potassium channel family protein [Candidatus Sulfotelmatobacter sp.]
MQSHSPNMQRGPKPVTVYSHLVEVSHLLASVPSLLYGLLYLLLVPVFASIYYRLPHKSFHHATIQYEDSVRLTESDLRDDLAKVLSRNLERELGQDRFLEEWKIARPRVGNLEIGPNDVTTRIYILLSLGGTPLQLAIQLQCKATFNLHPIFMKGDQDFKRVVVDESEVSALFQRIKSTTPDMPSLDTHRFLQVLFSPSKEDGQTLAGFELVIPRSVSRKCEEYADALNGFPTMLRGHYLRMLYLSAMTMTTSFGDILPITGTARTLVTAQSITSVAIIGLFLNALANQWGK